LKNVFSLKKFGSDPAGDWFLILLASVVLVVCVLVWSIVQFVSTRSFLNDIEAGIATGASNIDKTSEEKTQEVLRFYEMKTKLHNSLLDRSKVDTKKEQAAAILASSTTTTSSSSTSTTSSGEAGN